MADDIDIEEHDIMDNPKLKNIFQCKANIKSEVIDIEDESEYQEYMDHNKIIKTEPIKYESNPNINSNVIIFGTKPSTLQPYHEPTSSTSQKSITNQITFEEEEDNDDSDDDDNDDYSDGTDEDPDIIPCSVVLEDCHSLLLNNHCYCTECDILFPTPNTIESHRMTAHSFLVAVSRNIAVKSTSKRSIQDNVAVGRNKAVKSTSKNSKKHDDKTNNLKRPDLLCQHCNIYYPSKTDLIMHLNSLLPPTEQSRIVEKPLHIKSNNELSEEELYIMCSICYAFYKRKENFLSHILLHHGNYYLKKVMTPFDPHCKHCQICIMSPKKFNCHIKVQHTEMYLKRNNYEGEHYQCHMCKQTFLSANAEQIHRWLKHPTDGKQTDSNFRKALLLGKAINNPIQRKSHKLCASDTKALQNLKKNKNKMVQNQNVTSERKKNIQKHEPIDTSYNKFVPKSHLFKCGKCQMHFISPSAAFEHTNHCMFVKDHWKCRPCKRTFKMTDRQMHINQHSLNARFKVIIISEDVLARVLNRCGICNVCFEDKTFSKYHGSDCKPCPSVECEVCHLQIHKFAVVSHSRTHTGLGLKKNDFIIIDYHKISDLNSNSPEIITNSKVYHVTYNKVYYCLNCKMYTTRKRSQDGHDKGHCVGRKCERELCRLCGLVFSKRGIVTHKAYHKMFNIKLDTLVIVNILNGKRIRPPLPEFMLCADCQVYFVSRVALQNHVCNAEEHKSCQFCHKKFSDLAHKLHLPFHQLPKGATAIVKMPVNKVTVKGKSKSLASVGLKTFVTEKQKKPTPIHDLIKKYESLVTVWNILYRCQTCEIVFDSYDSIVEHCQDHFCNMEKYNLNIKYCAECDLKVVDKYYSRHEQLHSHNSVSIESFTIIDCHYSLLLSDKWQTVFNKLSKDQLDQVMSKSIYNEIRDVRMSLLSDGDLGSIYKCSLCNVSVNLQFVVDHVKNRDCNVSDGRAICDVCDVAFSQKKTANSHKQKHNLNDMPFRIVSFNDPKTFFIDEALIKSAKADELKFVRCQYCGKLINKSLYGMHIYKHNYRKKIKLLKNQPLKCNNSVVPSVKGKTIDQKSMFRYYICKKCAVAGLKVNKHICCDVERKKCTKCRVFIKGDSSTLWRHKKIHENYPTLSYKTVKITYFDPKEMNKKGKDVTKLYQNKLKAAPIPIAKSTAVSLLTKFYKKLRFVRCAQCTKCITHKFFRSHQCKANVKLLKCHLCGINIDKRHYAHHLRLHEQISFTKNDITVTTFDYKSGKFLNKVGARSSPIHKPEAIEQSNLNSSLELDSSSQDTKFHSDIGYKHEFMRVFKCTGCALLFVCRANLLEHVAGSRGACEQRAGKSCEYCNLNFHPSDIKKHKTVQFCRTRKVSMINVCTLVLKTADPNDDNNWLFYCKKCDFYNTNAMKSHFDSKHKGAATTVPCLKCGVRFAKCCIKKHNIFHHGSVDVPLANLNVEVMEDCTLEEVGYVSSTHDDSLDSSRVTVDENIADNRRSRIKKGGNTYARTPKNYVPDIFRCPTCNLHFVNRISLNSHKLRNEHYVKKIPCKKCGLPFSKTTVSKHLAMHDFTDTFNVVDASESPKHGRKCNTSNMSLDISDTQDSMPQRNSAVSNDEREEVNSNPTTPSQSNLPTVIKVQEAADSSGTLSNEISSTNSISHATSTTEVKLFKCGECDVYFMTAECCSYHTDNHSPLEPTEYSACKFCDLQFLNRSLVEHMKDHREKTFNMDTLVVDEYQPNEHHVSINTYSAIDRLKSKLVSTTTESD